MSDYFWIFSHILHYLYESNPAIVTTLFAFYNTIHKLICLQHI